ncbi:related to thioredoxin-like protein [Cephalotrichum gorgonifer]|uniref:Related to thioredoxin-like protein n=1 Tax=Cephalotrichum gorgonifer TaxID=2041049 RepID=A0AAE8MPR4_9PEZI|nr:related to thioredoxin-like protein [Cephalotrichum gorgonifer]
MANITNISSSSELAELLQKSRVVVADFYADWCGPCKAIAPLYEKCAETFAKPGAITFVKVNTETQKDIARAYRVTSLPTFILFRDGKEVSKVTGADPTKLQEMVNKISDAAGESSGSGSGGDVWMGAGLPRGYGDVTSQIEPKGCELLNVDDDAPPVQVLFDSTKPSALDESRAAALKASGEKDWIDSGADDQLLLFMPFQSVVKLHTIQITSIPPSAAEDDDDEPPMRPALIHLYTNKPHNLDFSEADDTPPTQAITLTSSDWNADGTANISLRFVKFQNISSLIIYVNKGDGEGEKVRVDRIRLIGEAGEKRDMGKLEKMGDLPGE